MLEYVERRGIEGSEQAVFFFFLGANRESIARRVKYSTTQRQPSGAGEEPEKLSNRPFTDPKDFFFFFSTKGYFTSNEITRKGPKRLSYQPWSRSSGTDPNDLSRLKSAFGVEIT
jgi:hypothetical protein